MYHVLLLDANHEEIERSSPSPVERSGPQETRVFYFVFFLILNR